MRVLVAEDRPSLQVAYKFLAEDWHIDLDVVSNGLEAVEQVDRNPYDLCILDMRMPVMGGEESAKRIRSKRYMPILVLSADAPFLHSKAMEYFDDYLEKPFEMGELYRKISELTVKQISAKKVDNSIRWCEETPMNPDYLKKLRELDKEGLTILKINQGCLIVRKNVQNKISHEFVENNNEVVEFLEHSEEHGVVHLYRNRFNLDFSIRVVTPEDFERMSIEEKEEMKKCTVTVFT